MVLADTSAWSWSRRHAYPELRESFDRRLIEGQVAICGTVRLELLHSSRNETEFAALSDEFDALPQVPMGAEIWERALWTYGRLAARGGKAHRSIKHPDLLIAAAAELAELPVLHYDRDYADVAAVTGQPIEWLAPEGSLR